MFRGAPKFSVLFLAVVIICAILAPWITPYHAVESDLDNVLGPPNTSGNLLGTDHLGRDVLTRIIHGARISVTVGFLAVFVSGAIGTTVAVFSGVFKGWVDRILMRITDGFLALPFLMVAIAVIAILTPSIVNVILVIGLLRWMTYARVLRSQVLTITEMDYVKLATVAGASRLRIIVRHILPNLANTLIVIGTLELGNAVIFEASLSFLGLGVPRPLPSWGTMLTEAQPYLYNSWWLPVAPGIAIFLLVMSSNLIGDWLRDRIDPTFRQL